MKYPPSKVDIAIIGAGTAGLTARSIVSKFTDNYVVIDNGQLGTTCARVGCMPSKSLIQIANYYYSFKKIQQHGLITTHSQERVNLEKILTHVRSQRDRFVKSVLLPMHKWHNKFIAKKAKFLDNHTLDLEGKKLEANKIIIATGSQVNIPNIFKHFSSYVLTTNVLFEQKTLPKKILIIGLGPIGLEIGQALSRLGYEVTAITRNKRIGGMSNPKIQDYILKQLQKEFKIIVDDIKLIEKNNNQLTISLEKSKETICVDKILLAAGRQPNLKDLDIHKTNITLNNKNLPHFNVYTGQIENTSIYIAGDINGYAPILHETADEGNLVGYHATSNSLPDNFTRRTHLYITFSSPQICVIGLSYHHLVNNNMNFITGEVSYEGQGRAITKLEEIGLCQIYVNPEDAVILGAELFAPDAEHLAHLIAWSIEFKKNIFDLLSCPFYHPTLEEGLRTALRKIVKKLHNKTLINPNKMSFFETL